MDKLATLIEQFAQGVKEQVNEAQSSIREDYAKIAQIKNDIMQKNAMLGTLSEYCRDIANTVASVAMTIDGVVEDNYDNIATVPSDVATRTYDEQVAEDDEVDDDELADDDDDDHDFDERHAFAQSRRFLRREDAFYPFYSHKFVLHLVRNSTPILRREPLLA